MHVIPRSRLKTFWEKNPSSANSLKLWYKLTTSANWQSFVELRKCYPSADLVKNFAIFNIGGNKFRLITLIDYRYQKVFIRDILTHSEYNLEKWKDDNWYQ